MTPEERSDVAHQRLESLYEISQIFATAERIEETLDEVLQVVMRTLPLCSAILIESSAERSRVVVWAAEGVDPAPAKANALSAYTYLVGAQSTNAVRLEETAPRSLREVAGTEEAAEPRRIVLPLVSALRTTFGALQLESTAPLEPTDLFFINAVATQLGVALDRIIAWEGDVARRRRAVEEARADADAKAATAERRRIEAEAATDRYEALVDHLDRAFVWELDARTLRVTYVSARVEALLGHPRARWLTDERFWLACAHEEDRESLQSTLERALVEGSDQRCDHRCIASDGTVSWLHTGVHFAGGDPAAPVLQCVSTDITAAKEAESRIRGQLEFTRAMAASVAEGVVAIDQARHVSFLNEAAEQWIGGTGIRSLARRLETLTTSESGEHVECPLYTVLRTGEPLRSEEHFFSGRNGARFPVSYSAAPIRQAGRVTGAVLAFADISERRHAEEAQRLLIEASRVLSESLDYSSALRRLAQLTLPKLGDFCFFDVAGGDDRIDRVAWAHVDPALQQALDDVQGHPPGLEFSRWHVARVIRTATPEIVDEEWLRANEPSEGRRLLAGEHAPRSMMIVPLPLGRRGTGALSFVFAASGRRHSHTDLGLAEELGRRGALALENGRLYEQARQAVRDREQVLAIVSHDLRGPLGTMMMAARLLEKTIGTDPSGRLARRQLDIIQRAAKLNLRLIDDLLDFASIESGRLSISVAPQDVAGLIGEAVATSEASAAERAVALVMEVEPHLPLVLADRDRILQVLANLLTNAVKVQPEGGRVVVRAAAREREVVFEVCDTGPGIAAQDAPRVFERYWRGGATYRGTGLGLGIAQGIVQAHGGRIWVESERGRGTTFYFTVPRADRDRKSDDAVAP